MKYASNIETMSVSVLSSLLSIILSFPQRLSTLLCIHNQLIMKYTSNYSIFLNHKNSII